MNRPIESTAESLPAPDPDYWEVVEQIEIMIAESCEEGVDLAEFFARLHSAGFALMALMLTLPFLQPIPLGPLGTAVGIALAGLGWQMFCGRERPVLPQKLLHLRLRGRSITWALGFSLRLLKFLRRFCQPRLEHWVSGSRGRRWIGALIATGGVLMTAPFVAVPCNNMFPACIAFFAALAELERDGAMLWISIGWLVLTLLFFAALTVLFILFGVGALKMIFPFL